MALPWASLINKLQPQSAFDIIGPGRRLGEEGEATPLEPAPATSEEVEQYEQIFNREGEHYDEDGEEREEMDEDVDDDDYYEDPLRNHVQQSTSFPPLDPTPGETVECEVCYEDYPVSEFPPNKITAVCLHEAKVCYGCLEKDIAVQIGEGVLGQLKCPSCPEKLSYEDIQAYASPDVFHRLVLNRFTNYPLLI